MKCTHTSMQNTVTQKTGSHLVNFPCEADCGPENKAKLVGIFYNKAKHLIFVHAKYQTITLTC